LHIFIGVDLKGIVILANGFSADAEMALLTMRRTRLKMLVTVINQRAVKILAVQDNSGVFLAMLLRNPLPPAQK
jgi:CBS domain containing-hemolysin-like protein